MLNDQKQSPCNNGFCIYLCGSILISLLAMSAMISPHPLYSAGSEQYSFVGKWGSKGVGHGMFSQPTGIATDSIGNVYVGDFTGVSGKIQKFTSNGTFIT
ncbi:MAG: hypothetical protein WBP64_20340, partial [Nitrososphaeraceae archaeon]